MYVAKEHYILTLENGKTISTCCEYIYPGTNTKVHKKKTKKGDKNKRRESNWFT